MRERWDGRKGERNGPCSSKEARQGWWGVLEPKLLIGGVPHLPGTALHQCFCHIQSEEGAAGGKGVLPQSPAESAVGQSPCSKIQEMQGRSMFSAKRTVVTFRTSRVGALREGMRKSSGLAGNFHCLDAGW